jgi:hypothetical protein
MTKAMVTDRVIDVRALVSDASVIDGDAAAKLAAALDWPAGSLLRVRIAATSDGSAKPSEVARALGVWGSEDPRGAHALVARLGVVTAGDHVIAQPRVSALPDSAEFKR